MSRLKSVSLPVALFFYATVAAAVVTLAQTKEASLTVVVKDQFGSVVEKARVSLGKIDEKERQGATDKSGAVEFPKLRAGAEYRISVTAEGFQKYEGEKIVFQNGEKRRLEVVLEVAPVESKVEVGGEDSLSADSAEKSGATTVLNEREIAALPDDPAELERVIRRIAESVTGGGGDQASVTVNGVEGAKIPPKQAIQQIRVNQNVFSAQYDNAFGGGIEIFTHAGVDRFRTYLSFSFADSRFNAADPFLGRRQPYQSRNYFFNVSGPLFGKKANFFVYGGHNESDSSAVVNAIVLDSNLQPVAFQESFAVRSRSENLYLNVNADPTKKHKLFFSYRMYANRSRGAGVGGFSLPSRAGDYRSQDHSLTFSDTYLINANVVNQTRFLFDYSAAENFGGDDATPALNVLEAFFGGGSQQNVSNANFRFNASNDTTWQMGKYALAFGWRVRGERVDQNSRSNFGGTYTFGGRLAPVLDAANNPVTDAAGHPVTTQISSLESYRRTLLLRGLGFSSQRIRELGGGASQFTISGGNPEISQAQYDYAFYVQNSYKLSETVAASFGVRYENQTNIASRLNFAPRFGVIWAPKAKEKQNPLYALPRVSVGYGLFYTRFPLANTLSVRQANDPDRAQYLVTEPGLLDIYPAAPSIALLDQFALSRSRRFIDERLETPYQSLFNLTANKKLPRGFTLNFLFSRNRTSRLALTRNVNAPLAGTFDPLNFAAAIRPFGNVGNVYLTESAAGAEGTRFSVSLGFPNSESLYASVRYGYIKGKNGVTSGSGSPSDPYDFSREYAPTPYDGVHSVSGYFFYNLTRYKISVGGDFYISSGTRFNIYTGRDTNGDGFFSERPAFAADLSKPNLIETPYGVLDPNPSPGDLLIPRNLGRGPGRVDFNTYLSKAFAFGEDKKNKKPAKQTLSFSVRISNAFNIINRSNPVGNMSSPNFLRSLSGVSDSAGSVFINGAPEVNFSGRNMSFSVGFSF